MGQAQDHPTFVALGTSFPKSPWAFGSLDLTVSEIPHSLMSNAPMMVGQGRG